MQLILKPITQPELGDIIVHDDLFAVGRHEEPFAGYASRLVTRLSRRHARIFEQDGSVYLADIGSLNGTTANGEAVDKIPVKLQSGSEVCFAGLCYQVEILGPADRGASQHSAAVPATLVLKPENPDAGLEPIVVSKFPFLVNKKSEVFARYAECLPDQLKFVSRRHAHIFVRHERLYIEDLGSTNGTYISGARLEEHAYPLADGDVIAFGGDCFVYRVELAYGDAAAPQPTPAVEDATRTTFVTSATSFLDIFCSDSEEEADAAPSAVTTDQSPVDTGAAHRTHAWWAPLARLRLSLREIRRTLADDTPRRPRRLWIGGAVLAGAAGIAAAVYLSTAVPRNITHLMTAGKYQQAVAVADAYLETHSNDRQVGVLATRALLKGTGPAWVRFVTTGNFDAANKTLKSARQSSAHDDAAAPLIAAMQWVTDMEQVVADRGGASAPVVIFEHEDRVKHLLAWWKSDTDAHRTSLDTIAREVPAFTDLRVRVFSHQRLLQGHEALEFPAIDDLRKTVDDKLQGGNAEDLPAVLSDFESRYPHIRGTEKLNVDLMRYLPIEAQIKSRHWLQASAGLAAVQFQTPPFRARAAFVAAHLLPDQAVLQRYGQAAQAWRAGDREQATRLFQQLATTRWPEPAERELRRTAQISSNYARLEAARGTPAYEEQLLEFYTALDRNRDTYFLKILKGEFESQREKVMVRARSAFADARSSWQKYRDRGGIDAQQRLEARISPAFRDLANILTRAYQQASYAHKLFGLLDVREPQQWEGLYTQIAKEVALQRRSLADLAMVLEPSLRRTKLQLIPPLQAYPFADRTEQESSAGSKGNANR